MSSFVLTDSNEPSPTESDYARTNFGDGIGLYFQIAILLHLELAYGSKYWSIHIISTDKLSVLVDTALFLQFIGIHMLIGAYWLVSQAYDQ